MNKQTKELKKPSDYPTLSIRPKVGQKERLKGLRKQFKNWGVMVDIWEEALIKYLNK